MQRQISNENGQKPQLIINRTAKLSRSLKEGGFDIKYYQQILPIQQQDKTRVNSPYIVRQQILKEEDSTNH